MKWKRQGDGIGDGGEKIEKKSGPRAKKNLFASAGPMENSSNAKTVPQDQSRHVRNTGERIIRVLVDDIIKVYHLTGINALPAPGGLVSTQAPTSLPHELPRLET